MNRSTPGLPVHHHLPEFTQTHVHRVRDAIQPSHLQSSPSPPGPNPSQHHSLFQWVNSSHEVAKVLELQLYHHSFQRNPRVDLLQNGLVGSPCSPRDSPESMLKPPYWQTLPYPSPCLTQQPQYPLLGILFWFIPIHGTWPIPSGHLIIVICSWAELSKLGAFYLPVVTSFKD